MYSRQVTSENGLAFLSAIALSFCTSVIVGGIFLKDLRRGPMIIGGALGSVLAMTAVPVVEMAIQKATNNIEFDIGRNAALVVISLGCLIGFYLGRKLAFFILVSC